MTTIPPVVLGSFLYKEERGNLEALVTRLYEQTMSEIAVLENTERILVRSSVLARG